MNMLVLLSLLSYVKPKSSQEYHSMINRIRFYIFSYKFTINLSHAAPMSSMTPHFALEEIKLSWLHSGIYSYIRLKLLSAKFFCS